MRAPCEHGRRRGAAGTPFWVKYPIRPARIARSSPLRPAAERGGGAQRGLADPALISHDRLFEEGLEAGGLELRGGVAGEDDLLHGPLAVGDGQAVGVAEDGRRRLVERRGGPPGGGGPRA